MGLLAYSTHASVLSSREGAAAAIHVMQSASDQMLRCKPRECEHAGARVLCEIPENCPHYDREAGP